MRSGRVWHGHMVLGASGGFDSRRHVWPKGLGYGVVCFGVVRSGEAMLGMVGSVWRGVWHGTVRRGVIR